MNNFVCQNVLYLFLGSLFTPIENASNAMLTWTKLDIESLDLESKIDVRG